MGTTMVLLNNGTTVHIVEYLENSLGRHSNRSLEEMVLLSVGMSLYTILGVLGEFVSGVFDVEFLN